jgi:hypothetical protein
MKYEVVIDRNKPTDIRHLKECNAKVERLVLKGKGELNGCLLTFSNKDDGPHGQKDLLLLKPIHEKENILLPHNKHLVVSPYDYCSIQIFTGNMRDDDIITMYLSTGV